MESSESREGVVQTRGGGAGDVASAAAQMTRQGCAIMVKLRTIVGEAPVYTDRP
jgi:hypothetical protein